jgi:hypothetical protein
VLGGVKTPGLVSLLSDPRSPRITHQIFFDFSKSLENSKNFPDYREYSKYCEYRVNSSNL